jgi:hypothetical protein
VALGAGRFSVDAAAGRWLAPDEAT